MITGLKKRFIPCDRCHHSMVCSYKNDYLNALNKLEEVFYSISESNRSGIIFRNPDCKFTTNINENIDIPNFRKAGDQCSDTVNLNPPYRHL